MSAYVFVLNTIYDKQDTVRSDDSMYVELMD